LAESNKLLEDYPRYHQPRNIPNHFAHESAFGSPKNPDRANCLKTKNIIYRSFVQFTKFIQDESKSRASLGKTIQDQIITDCRQKITKFMSDQKRLVVNQKRQIGELKVCHKNML